MANQSIYSEEWIDVVFENRNKEYGAYQLRHENPKTTLKALGIGVLLLTFLVSIPMMMNLFGTEPTATASIPELVTPLVISPVIYPPKKTDTKDLFPSLTQKENKKPKTDIKKENLIDPKVTEAENAVTEIAPNDDPKENDVVWARYALPDLRPRGHEGRGFAPLARRYVYPTPSGMCFL